MVRGRRVERRSRDDVAVRRRERKRSRDRRGAIRALNHLVSEPLVYSYSREPKDAETPAVTASWRLWWSRQNKPEPVTPERIAELRQAVEELSQAPSRMALMEGLEQFTRRDAPYFAERLLDESASLAEKNIAAIVLRLYIGKPLATDVSVSADKDTVAQVTEHWQLYYRLAHDRLTPPSRRACGTSWPTRICEHGLAVGDVQFRAIGAQNA